MTFASNAIAVLSTVMVGTSVGISPQPSLVTMCSQLTLLKKRVIVAIAFAVIAAAFTPFRVIMFTSSSYIADVSWIAEAVATAAFAAAMLVALYNVNFEIQEKYLTD